MSEIALHREFLNSCPVTSLQLLYLWRMSWTK